MVLLLPILAIDGALPIYGVNCVNNSTNEEESSIIVIIYTILTPY